MPQISVIVPVYKVEAYLPACIDSILIQSFTDFELILVDDGSPDSCGAICDAYAQRDPRIRVIHQENRGLSGARNSGMDIAAGEFITFIDSDDLVHERYLEILTAAMDADTDIAVCRYQEFEEDKTPEDRKVIAVVNTALTPEAALLDIYEGGGKIAINACSKLFRQTVVENLRFPEGRIHEDQAFVPYACYQARKIVFCDAQLYDYRMRSASITKEQFSLKRYDDLWAIDNCIAFFRERGETKIVEAALRKRQRLICVYAIYARRDGVQVPEEYRISIFKALTYLRRHVSDDKYSYYLCQVNSKLVRPHAYVRKLESLFVKSR